MTNFSPREIVSELDRYIVGHRSVRYSDGFHQRGKCGVLLPGGVCGGSHGILGHRNCVRAAEPLCGAEIFKKR